MNSLCSPCCSFLATDSHSAAESAGLTAVADAVKSKIEAMQKEHAAEEEEHHTELETLESQVQ